jgi:hydrogenase maturation protease
MTTLVVGYGNVLRGDDAAGPCVAEALAERRLPGVHAIAVQQLTPELAALIAEAETVIFVDAHAAEPDGDVTLVALDAGGEAEPFAHSADPRSLLALAKALYGVCPQAFLVMIPGVQFAIGDRISPVTEVGILDAMRMLEVRLIPTPAT